jgi:hypothetical protein
MRVYPREEGSPSTPSFDSNQFSELSQFSGLNNQLTELSQLNLTQLFSSSLGKNSYDTKFFKRINTKLNPVFTLMPDYKIYLQNSVVLEIGMK